MAANGLKGRRDEEGGGGRVLDERSAAGWYKGKRESHKGVEDRLRERERERDGALDKVSTLSAD